MWLTHLALCGFTLSPFFPLAVISEYDTTPSDYSDDVMFIVHDLSAVEEEHSTDVQSDHDKETHFLSRMYVIRDFYEPSKTISFNYGDVVEVLDTQLEDKWLVRKKDDTLQVS